VQHLDTFQFFDENGGALVLKYTKGGVFSEGSGLLYVLNVHMEEYHDSYGINVLDTQTWRRVRQSTNGKMPLNCELHPEYCEYAEAERMIIWDLDDGRAPGIRGTLHALMLDNDYGLCFDDTIDDVYLKHYTESIHVDSSYYGSEEGTPDKPFHTVVEVNNMAWNGQKLKIQAGSYNEALTFSK
jgi:hypothetical protein